MRKVALIVMALVFLTGTANAQRLTEREQSIWETCREIAIRRTRHTYAFDEAMILEEVKTRLINGRIVKEGEPIEDKDSVIVPFNGAEGNILLQISRYEDEGEIYYITVYHDGDILKRYELSEKYLLYAVEEMDHHYSDDATVEISAEKIATEIKRRLKWEKEDPLLPIIIGNNIKKLK